MCGLIGFTGNNTPEGRKLLRALIVESSYRGLHSLGMAMEFQGHLDVEHAAPYPGHGAIAEWLEATLGERPRTNAILHLRYCTSDPKWPLPIIQDGTAVVLNGVISQGHPLDWPNPTGELYLTGNDAEIALRYHNEGLLPDHGGSWALGFLSSDGEQRWLRNGDRPLWSFTANGGAYRACCSTHNIAVRACQSAGLVLSSVSRFHAIEDRQQQCPTVTPVSL